MREGWEYKKLGEICNVINGLWTGKKEPFINVAVIRNTNFSKDCQLNLDNVAYIDVEAKQFASRKLLFGDIIIEKSGGSEKQPVGRPILFNISEGDYSFSNFTSTLRIKEDAKVESSFLHKCLYAFYLKGETLKLQSKTTGLHNLNMKGYLRQNIPLPPKSTQLAIVSELDKINELIRLKKEQLKDFDNLAQSLFYEMFGDPVENEMGWEVKKLGEVCNITSSKRIFADEYTDKGIPFYRSKEVIERSKGLPISVELFISPERYSEIKEKFGIPNVGDILVTAVGTIGKIWSIDTDEKFYFKDGNLVWLKDIDSSLVNTIFFRRLLEYLIDEYKKINANGAAYSALTIAKLKLMQCPLPPLPLQHLFAQRIEQIEHQKAEVQKSITDLETLLASRMQYWFE